MGAKNFESLRQKLAGKNVVRLFLTSTFIDDKWLKGITHSTLKKYLVLKYPSANDQYVPEWKVVDGEKVQWWDAVTHNKIKSKIKGYKSDKWDKTKKDDSKKDKAADLLNSSILSGCFTTDDWMVAQDKYIEWCSAEGVDLDYLKVGKKSGDD